MEYFGNLITSIEVADDTIQESDDLIVSLWPMNVMGVTQKEGATTVGYIEKYDAQVLAVMMDRQKLTISSTRHEPEGGNRYKLYIEINANRDIFATLYYFFLAARCTLIIPNGYKNVMNRKYLTNAFDIVDLKLITKLEPLDPPTDLIKTSLSLKQREDLGWLYRQEHNDSWPPFWFKRDQEGYYVNALTKERKENVNPCRGGIYVHSNLDMPLVLLSLISFDIDEKMKDVLSKERAKKQKFDHEVFHGNSLVKPTLILCLHRNFSRWVGEIEKHLGPLFSWCVYSAATRPMLQAYNLVFVAYGDIDETILGLEWSRVIFDEGADFRSLNPTQAFSLENLKSERTWILFSNTDELLAPDMECLLASIKFLRIGDDKFWGRLVGEWLNDGKIVALWQLQVLMGIIAFRRRNPGVFNKIVHNHFVKLREGESQFYDRAQSGIKSFIAKYIKCVDQTNTEYTTALSLILRLRQFCTEGELIPSDVTNLLMNNIEDIPKYPDQQQQLELVLQESEEKQCLKCLSQKGNFVITSCGHIFCQDCKLECQQKSSLGTAACPQCGKDFSPFDLPPTNVMISNLHTSSKAAALLELISVSTLNNSITKSVVFSQFPRSLSLLGMSPESNDFQVSYLFGSMEAEQKDEIQRQFEASTSHSVILSSLSALAYGINIAYASTVYMLEPWLYPEIEENVINSVHKIAKVVRLIARDTIEERVLHLQKEKMKPATILQINSEPTPENIDMSTFKTLMIL